MIIQIQDGLRFNVKRLTRRALVMDNTAELITVFYLYRNHKTVIADRDDGIAKVGCLIASDDVIQLGPDILFALFNSRAYPFQCGRGIILDRPIFIDCCFDPPCDFRQYNQPSNQFVQDKEGNLVVFEPLEELDDFSCGLQYPTDFGDFFTIQSAAYLKTLQMAADGF